MSDKATTIRPTCPKCGKTMCIELPGYDKLREENYQLRQQVKILKHRFDDTSIGWFEKALRGEL